MDTKLILPLNESPSIYTCIHHAYPLAIIESKDLARIAVNHYENYEWNYITYDTTVFIEQEVINVLESGNGENTNTVIWRNCKEQDEILIEIKYLRPIDTGRYIDVFIFNDNVDAEISLEDKSCGIRWNPYGYFIKKEMHCFDTKIYKFLKLIVNESEIVGFASKDGMDWEIVGNTVIPDYFKNHMKIGIHTHTGENYYPLWKNMNFIQLSYNIDSQWKGIYLDYYFFPRKNVDNSYMYFPNFLDTHYDTTYDALECFSSIHEYLKWNLQHFYYPEICLNEFYVPQRRHYGVADYNHYNLFYGYNDDDRVYYIMGYSNKSKPIVSKLPYDSFDNNIITSEKIVRYKYCSNDVTNFRYNLIPVKNSIYEFLHSIDSSEKVSNFLTQEPLIYGLSIFKFLATNELGQNMIIEDRRISFCILEHSKLMREKVFFFYENGFLKKNIYDELLELNDEIIQKATIIMGLHIKGLIKQKKYEHIYIHLLELYDMEKKFFSKLLNYLD